MNIPQMQYFNLLETKIRLAPTFQNTNKWKLIDRFHYSWNVTVWRRRHEWNGIVSRQILIRYIFAQEIGFDQELESDCWVLSIVSTQKKTISSVFGRQCSMNLNYLFQITISTVFGTEDKYIDAFAEKTLQHPSEIFRIPGIGWFGCSIGFSLQ